MLEECKFTSDRIDTINKIYQVSQAYEWMTKQWSGIFLDDFRRVIKLVFGNKPTVLDVFEDICASGLHSVTDDHLC